MRAMYTRANNGTTQGLDLESLRSLMDKMEREHQELIRQGVEAARSVQCPTCFQRANYCVDPYEGFVVCDHLLETIKETFVPTPSPVPIANVLGGLAVFTWGGWFRSIPAGYVPTIDKFGALAWKKITGADGLLDHENTKNN